MSTYSMVAAGLRLPRILDQGLVGDGLADKAAVVAAARDKGDQGRSKLEDGGALKPMIGP